MLSAVFQGSSKKQSSFKLDERKTELLKSIFFGQNAHSLVSFQSTSRKGLTPLRVRLSMCLNCLQMLKDVLKHIEKSGHFFLTWR